MLVEMRRDIAELKAELNRRRSDMPASPAAFTGVRTKTPDDSNDYQMAEIVDMDTAHRKPEEDSKSLQEVDKEHIQNVLDQYKGNRKAAADALGIPERTLYRRIKKYGLK